jgi:hypothetical protein
MQCRNLLRPLCIDRCSRIGIPRDAPTGCMSMSGRVGVDLEPIFGRETVDMENEQIAHPRSGILFN